MTDPATLYEEWFVPAVFAPSARQVLDQTEVSPGARVLDVACGSGIMARTIARLLGPDGTVVGLDANPAMLATARRVSEAEGLRVSWVQGSAQELPFEDRSFDLVVCQHGLQFFPDRAGAVGEMYRVLAPGGRAVLVTWRGLEQNPFFAEYERAVSSRFHSPALEIPFSLGDPAVLGGLLLDVGFADVAVAPLDMEADYTQPERFIEYQVIASAAAIPSLQGLSAAERDALIAAIRQDLDAPVRAATVGDRLRFPMSGIVATGVHP
jgi:SAM-dependent methyltransferase